MLSNISLLGYLVKLDCSDRYRFTFEYKQMMRLNPRVWQTFKYNIYLNYSTIMY